MSLNYASVIHQCWRTIICWFTGLVAFNNAKTLLWCSKITRWFTGLISLKDATLYFYVVYYRLLCCVYQVQMPFNVFPSTL